MFHDGSILYYDLHSRAEILPYGDSNGDGLSCLYLATGHKKQQTVFHVYALQDGVWAIRSSAVSEIPKLNLLSPDLLGDAKIYNVASVDGIYKLVVLDLVSSSLALVNLPEEVDLGFIWLHTMDDNGVPNWLLVDTICLHEICVKHMIPTCMLKDDSITIHPVGVNSEIIFLEMGKVLYLFDNKQKVAKKVYEVTTEDRHLFLVIPFMMVWPPKFPVMKEICDPKE
ncbi:hypothetical protein BRADI_1g31276v3 [Brachypodium distachyon]|uniref:F-box protein AT5G49610-like beta-propeller domain-containing protein n=2 Tax=Brachypodium distachyon TaxID=15368 RepID=A0A0Q3H1T0_BRADI|nr:hypothetical protein BRADI_1g31276v3 [Brachypodium distachyon]